MARNSSGVYQKPYSPFLPGTTILSATVNGWNDDFATEITDSLSRSGKGAMLAPLQLTDGSAAAPSLTFDTDPQTGFWLASSGTVRIVTGASTLQEWTSTLVTIAKALSCSSTLAVTGAITGSAGLTVTQSTLNGAGVTTTGNGTGSGITATGGATGNGGTFSGGATSGAGVNATGTGNSSGVVTTGGGTGSGINAVGGATGNGGTFTGGSTSGHGLVATGTGNSKGAEFYGNGTAVGLTSVGGATAGGAYFQGGASGARGMQANGTGTSEGGLFNNGTAADASTRQKAIIAGNGDIDLSGVTDPASTTAISDQLTPNSFLKVHGYITTDGSSGATVEGGLNIASLTVGVVITINFASNFANTTYTVIPHVNFPTYDCIVQNRQVGSVNLAVYNSSGVAVDLSSTIVELDVMIAGVQ